MRYALCFLLFALMAAPAAANDQINTIESKYSVKESLDRLSAILTKKGIRVMARVNHAAGAKAAGLKEKDVVDLVSHFEGEERIGKNFYVVPFAIPRRCVATYFPEANVLVPVNSTADKSNTPASKSVVVTIHPHSA